MQGIYTMPATWQLVMVTWQSLSPVNEKAHKEQSSQHFLLQMSDLKIIINTRTMTARSAPSTPLPMPEVAVGGTKRTNRGRKKVWPFHPPSLPPAPAPPPPAKRQHILVSDDDDDDDDDEPATRRVRTPSPPSTPPGSGRVQWWHRIQENADMFFRNNDDHSKAIQIVNEAPDAMCRFHAATLVARKIRTLSRAGKKVPNRLVASFPERVKEARTFRFLCICTEVLPNEKWNACLLKKALGGLQPDLFVQIYDAGLVDPAISGLAATRLVSYLDVKQSIRLFSHPGATKARAMMSQIHNPRAQQIRQALGLQSACSRCQGQTYDQDNACPTHRRIVRQASQRAQVTLRRIKKNQPAIRLLRRCTMSALRQPSREAKEDETACVICLDSVRTIAFIPCGHLAACSDCAKRMMSQMVKECPMCRAKINAALTIYQ